jgi:hypothetical protein
MSNYTPGLLRVGKKYLFDIYADRAGHAVARAVNPQADGEDEANARRIVACIFSSVGSKSRQRSNR